MALEIISRWPGHLSGTPEWHPLEWRGLKFSNRLGTAGGVDKSGKQIRSWARLGAGFIEVGTITPRAQRANPGKIIDRDFKNQSLWNKMGFPNPGAASTFALLRKQKAPVPLFINIGKNRETTLENAALDYLECIRMLDEVADVFVINISSPNTSGLRNLQSSLELDRLLERVFYARATERPVFLKLSPDLSETDLYDALQISLKYPIAGWILTNTTLSRPGLLHYHPTEGGVSGAPLRTLSIQTLKRAVEWLKDRRQDQLIISVGGVLTPQEVIERLSLGADLVQVYSALVLSGPMFFRSVAMSLSSFPS